MKTKIALSLITSLALSQSIYANETNQDNKKEDNIKLGEIIVTAQKVEENIQRVPISMSVFDDTKIESSKINNLTEMTYHTPNLYAKQNINNKMVIMRGISSHNIQLNTPVGLFIDDINYPMNFMQNPDLVDVERVEILRGPQGTLYGRNTEAGAIKIITKKPSNETKGKLFLETGIYDTPSKNTMFTKVGGSISGAVQKDKLYMGLAFQKEKSDGYIENVNNGNNKAAKIDHTTAQLKLRLTPSDNTDISLIGNISRNDNGYGSMRYTTGSSITDRYKINWNSTNNKWEDKNNGQALKVEHKDKDYSLVAITTHNNFETDFQHDGEFGPIIVPDQKWLFDNKSMSQEVRISSPSNNRKLEWLFGLYGFKDKNNAKAEFFGTQKHTNFENKGYALFTQETYRLTDKFNITGGLRYDYYKAEGDHNNFSTASYSKDMNNSDILPKIALSYDFSEDILGYISASKGLLAGGYNYAFSNSSDNLTFEPESTWNYEIGLKSSFLDNTLIVNGALFYIDIKDKQVEEMITPPYVRNITNAAKAISKGLELDLMYKPNSNINIYAGLGITKTEVDEWTTATFDYKGKKLSHAPKYTYNLGLEYFFNSDYFVKTDILGVGDFYTDAKNMDKIDGYTTVNMSLNYIGEEWDFSLWAKNIFDKEYVTSKGTYILGNIAEDGEPRTIGFKITYNF